MQYGAGWLPEAAQRKVAHRGAEVGASPLARLSSEIKKLKQTW